MDKKIVKSEFIQIENDSLEGQDENSEDLPEIIINTVLPNDPENQNTHGRNVPLFIKKLWKMVDDGNSDEIISWNANGDGFIIHDQFKFVSQTLLKYFKHNHLSSFVRQLNLYDFHKTHKEKEEFEFSHPFFLKSVPQLLHLIKRKAPSGRQKSTTSNTSDTSSEIQQLMMAVKEMNSKSDIIFNELTKLRQENAALWSEMNSLRVKYSKQTKIINKLIHFLISYMQKHHNSRKGDRTVNTNNANKYLKAGPKIMELDYRYKNNPHAFWTEYDNQHKNFEQSEQEAYTVDEPVETIMELEDEIQSREGPNLTISSAIEELLTSPSSSSSVDQTLPQIDYTACQPSSSKMSTSLQRAGNSKENLGYFIDNTHVELSAIKELIKNLTPEELSNFYKLVNDNYKNQDDEVPLDISTEPEGIENELMALAEMSPIANIIQEQDVEMSLENNENELMMPFDTGDKPLNVGADLNTSSSMKEDNFLNPDDLLNNVDQFFN